MNRRARGQKKVTHLTIATVLLWAEGLKFGLRIMITAPMITRIKTVTDAPSIMLIVEDQNLDRNDSETQSKVRALAYKSRNLLYWRNRTDLSTGNLRFQGFE